MIRESTEQIIAKALQERRESIGAGEDGRRYLHPATVAILNKALGLNEGMFGDIQAKIQSIIASAKEFFHGLTSPEEAREAGERLGQKIVASVAGVPGATEILASAAEEFEANQGEYKQMIAAKFDKFAESVDIEAFVKNLSRLDEKFAGIKTFVAFLALAVGNLIATAGSASVDQIAKVGEFPSVSGESLVLMIFAAFAGVVAAFISAARKA